MRLGLSVGVKVGSKVGVGVSVGERVAVGTGVPDGCAVGGKGEGGSAVGEAVAAGVQAARKQSVNRTNSIKFLRIVFFLHPPPNGNEVKYFPN